MTVSGDDHSSISIPSKKGVTASFSRLKAQRVKALVNKQEGRLKQITEIVEHIDDSDVPTDNSNKHISVNKYLNSHTRRGSGRFSDPDGDYTRTRRDGGRVMGSVESDAYLRERGTGNSIRNLKHESTYVSKQRHKLSANRDFFSRKSFKELGCSDFMIESLKQQHFLRPSQIQVCL